MPELPEVETTKRGVSPHIQQKRVDDVIVRNPNLRWPVPSDLKETLQSKQLTSVERRAKYLLFYFDDNTEQALLVHLGMSGSLRIVPRTEIPLKHDHVDLVFNDISLRYSDPRRFGCIMWLPEAPLEHKLLSHLGPEPLSDAFDGDYLFAKSRKRNSAVKQFVMDQEVVTGIGNIYASEALYTAGVRPDRAAGKVTRRQYQLFAADAKRILERSIKQGGTTLRDFVGGDGKPGYFAQQLLVYGRKGEPCPTCEATLKEKRISNRSSVFCPKCQK